MSENVKSIINVDNQTNAYAIASPNSTNIDYGKIEEGPYSIPPKTRQLGIKSQGAKGSATGTDLTQTWVMSDGGEIKIYIDAPYSKDNKSSLKENTTKYEVTQTLLDKHGNAVVDLIIKKK
ncbi:hypothetical protein PG911_05565 [Tenacibaculum ovolyticum]|uniref:aegerolysin family protein n=1 Tax=Tenacibaculum ovolyticum TaxID=104270 RepID=UPI0022F3F111|nr:aegerolysin family protein [Tenacibaculum ovolyticum]WBX77727.1 hypothetical protein PG911_05565 [Tenacibaculum ovolyticum]